MSIRETFSNSIDLELINEYDKGTVTQISQCFGKFMVLLVEGSSEKGLFRHLSDYVFGVRNFGNKKRMRVIFYLQNI